MSVISKDNAKEPAMTTHSIEIHAHGEDGENTITDQMDWNGTAADLAVRIGAKLGVDLGHNGPRPSWRLTVRGTADVGEYTETDEWARQQARQEIMDEWAREVRPHEQMLNELNDRPGTERQQDDAMAAIDAARTRAGEKLEPLGYRIHTGMVDTVIDERTPNGLLSMIARAERDRADAEAAAAEYASDRDDLIRQAVALKVPAARLAEAAQVKPARIYQIRDGRR